MINIGGSFVSLIIINWFFKSVKNYTNNWVISKVYIWSLNSKFKNETLICSDKLGSFIPIISFIVCLINALKKIRVVIWWYDFECYSSVNIAWIFLC